VEDINFNNSKGRNYLFEKFICWEMFYSWLRGPVLSILLKSQLSIAPWKTNLGK
jgi:hypothetical protein